MKVEIEALMIATLAAACCWLNPCSAARTDDFSGIYSAISPETGDETDLLKVHLILGEYYFNANSGGPAKWTGFPQSARLVDAHHRYVTPAFFEQGAGVKVLLSDGVGYLYRVPAGEFSRLGRPYTGYLADLPYLGMFAVKRRPLGGGRTGQYYEKRADDLKVKVRALNYSGNSVALSVESPDDSYNAVDPDTLTPYSTGTETCCFYLPAKWRPGMRVVVDYKRLASPTVHRKMLTLPAYTSTRNLWMVVHEDETVEIVFSDQKTELLAVGPTDDAWKGSLKQPPSPPPAYRKERMAEELRSRRATLADFEGRRKVIAGRARNDLEESIYLTRNAVEYFGALASCPQPLDACSKRVRHEYAQ